MQKRQRLFLGLGRCHTEAKSRNKEAEKSIEAAHVRLLEHSKVAVEVGVH